MRGDTVVAVRGLTQRYGSTVALDAVDLTIGRGECVALLGPNGAGKTTLVHTLVGLLPARHGTVTVGGGDPRDAATRRRLGVVHQQAGFPRTLRVHELVRGWAVRAHRSPAQADAVMDEVGIADLVQRRVDKLSGGQQQRVQLAMALVVDPALLVLDEPTVGLDITARRTFWRILAERRDAGVAVLLTTHQVEEAAAVSDRVVVLDRGVVVASDDPVALTSQLPDRSISARTALRAAALRSLPDVLDVAGTDDRARLTSRRPEATVRALLDADPEVTDLRVEGASLEEAIVSLTATHVTEVPA